MIFRTSLQRWNIFSRSVVPLPNPKKLSNLSILQIDSYASSICVLADTLYIEISINRFNRLDRVFDFTVLDKYVQKDWYRNQYENFKTMTMFLRYIYNIDRGNEFAKSFVQYGSSKRFEILWNLVTNEYIYKAFKKIKKTDELIRRFWKKIKLGEEYARVVECFDITTSMPC